MHLNLPKWEISCYTTFIATTSIRKKYSGLYLNGRSTRIAVVNLKIKTFAVSGVDSTNAKFNRQSPQKSSDFKDEAWQKTILHKGSCTLPYMRTYCCTEEGTSVVEVPRSWHLHAHVPCARVYFSKQPFYIYKNTHGYTAFLFFAMHVTGQLWLPGTTTGEFYSVQTYALM